MKLSFSISSRPSSKSTAKPSKTFAEDEDCDKNNNAHEYVTEFDSSRSVAEANKPGNIVIRPIQNEWRPQKKMKNIDLPPIQSSDGSDQLSFEVVADAPPETTMSYGLNLRLPDQKSTGSEKQPQHEPVEDVLLQKLKNDLQRLPQDGRLEDYEEVPVEGYGAALLAGYGWHEGRGIGRKHKEDVKPVQYERRGDREGLGFDSKKEKQKENLDKEKASKAFKDTNRNHHEKQNHAKKQDHHLIGKDMRIIGGRDVGMRGRVVEVSGDNKLLLKLVRSGDEVRVRVRDVAELGSKEEEKCLNRLKEVKISEEGRSAGKRGRDAGRVEISKSTTSRSYSWLRSHIRVRIISKELKGGRLYLKKGEVMDVVGPRTCDIAMDESKEIIQGVDQDLLETALPRHGGPVLVLYGEHKGVHGSLVEKDLDKETGVVRDTDSHELLTLRLDQIAEYVGDPSYIGY